MLRSHSMESIDNLQAQLPQEHLATPAKENPYKGQRQDDPKVTALISPDADKHTSRQIGQASPLTVATDRGRSAHSTLEMFRQTSTLPRQVLRELDLLYSELLLLVLLWGHAI